MLARIPLRLFREWQAWWYLKGPSSEERMDWRFAQIAALVANAAGGKKGRAFKVKDFMPEFDRESKRQTPQEMRAVLAAMTGAMKQQQAQRESASKDEGGAP